jgi:hypothetical protein
LIKSVLAILAELSASYREINKQYLVYVNLTED